MSSSIRKSSRKQLAPWNPQQSQGTTVEANNWVNSSCSNSQASTPSSTIFAMQSRTPSQNSVCSAPGPAPSVPYTSDEQGQYSSQDNLTGSSAVASSVSYQNKRVTPAMVEVESRCGVPYSEESYNAAQTGKSYYNFQQQQNMGYQEPSLLTIEQLKQHDATVQSSFHRVSPPRGELLHSSGASHQREQNPEHFRPAAIQIPPRGMLQRSSTVSYHRDHSFDKEFRPAPIQVPPRGMLQRSSSVSQQREQSHDNDFLLGLSAQEYARPSLVKQGAQAILDSPHTPHHALRSDAYRQQPAIADRHSHSVRSTNLETEDLSSSMNALRLEDMKGIISREHSGEIGDNLSQHSNASHHSNLSQHSSHSHISNGSYNSFSGIDFIPNIIAPDDNSNINSSGIQLHNSYSNTSLDNRKSPVEETTPVEDNRTNMRPTLSTRSISSAAYALLTADEEDD